jgi:hypothetical protein
MAYKKPAEKASIPAGKLQEKGRIKGLFRSSLLDFCVKKHIFLTITKS